MTRRYFRGDAAFAKPELYELLEAEGYRLRHPPAGQRGPAGADRPPADAAGRPPAEEAAGVLRQLQLPGAELEPAAPGGGQGRVAPGRAVPAGRLHRHQPERPAERVSKFYNGRGTAEQWIREGKNALRWTRLSCRSFQDNAVRLQLFALAYNLANFLRTLALPRRGRALVADHAAREAGQDRRQDRRHGRYVVFQLAEVAVPRALFAASWR